jgi:hypothetical protein
VSAVVTAHWLIELIATQLAQAGTALTRKTSGSIAF